MDVASKLEYDRKRRTDLRRRGLCLRCRARTEGSKAHCQKCRPKNAPKRRMITANGKTQGYAEWSAELGVSEQTLRNRIDSGMDHDRAMSPGMFQRGGPPIYEEAWEGARDTPWEDDDRAWAMVELCGRMTHAQVGSLMGIVRQRVQQIEAEAILKLRHNPEAAALLELFEERMAEKSAREQTLPETVEHGERFSPAKTHCKSRLPTAAEVQEAVGAA